MPSLLYCFAVLNETLRMFPPVVSIPKRVEEDTMITITNTAGERTTIPMPKGSTISLHAPGLHYNRTLVSLIILLRMPMLTSGLCFQHVIGKTRRHSTLHAL